jgi:hypothetical protein
MYFILSFILGVVFMNLHHMAIHKGKISYLTAIPTCGFFLIKLHKFHHIYFLQGADDFSWARTNESFYKFFVRTHFKRRKVGGWLLDLISFSLLTYFFGWLYLTFVLSFTFHWEMFEYWSHYRLRQETEDPFLWSWNVRDKVFNLLMFDLGKHSLHHVKKDYHYPLVYVGKPTDSYLPLFPSKFFKFMEKCVQLNREKGVL